VQSHPPRHPSRRQDRLGPERIALGRRAPYQVTGHLRGRARKQDSGQVRTRRPGASHPNGRQNDPAVMAVTQGPDVIMLT
jgi:hypothetical protein